MYRSLFVVLACTPAVLAQSSSDRNVARDGYYETVGPPRGAQGRDDQYYPERPRQFGDRPYYGPILGRISDNSLRSRDRQLDKPISTGLVLPELPDEALIDLEAWLREPTPAEELSLRRVGFRRPARGTVWREDFTLPDEELLRQDLIRLRNTIQEMQGVWRVHTLIIDNRPLLPEEFAGLKYFVQDTVLFQSETSESWQRSAPAVAQRKAAESATKLPGREPGERNVIQVPPPDETERLGPAGTSKPAPAERREDPRQEEGVRMNMLYRGEGRAAIYWWDRDADVVDPHESRNRPSLRVAFPVRGGIEVNDGMFILAARGVGLRALLPSKLHYRFNRLKVWPEEGRTPIEGERTVLMVMVRDEGLNNRTSDTKSGAEAERLSAGEPGSRGKRIEVPQMRRVPLNPIRQ